MTVDGKEAERWLLKAADAGSLDAQALLGMLYATGVGVAKDMSKAREFLIPAANSGDTKARRMLDLLGSHGG